MPIPGYLSVDMIIIVQRSRNQRQDVKIALFDTQEFYLGYYVYHTHNIIIKALTKIKRREAAIGRSIRTGIDVRKAIFI